MKEDKNKLERIRHSCAHLLAAAVKQLWPGTHNAIGPAIENGFYQDFDFGNVKISEADLEKIEKRMRELVETWGPFQTKEVSVDQAKKDFSNNPYKLELIEEFAQEGKTITENDPGNFLDLCKGGHVEDPKKELKHFKLLSIAGAYWRGNEKNKMLTRIYGTCFPTKEELDTYLKMIEESKKRDHRRLGKDLEIFTTSNEIGAGLILWLPKGTIIREQMENWARETEKKWGYQHVSTPHITKEDLYKISGHLPYYADDLYSPIDIEGEKYYLKPMNCPHTHMIYKSRTRSYKELPLRLAEYGQVYRFERSGTLHGLMRTRGFCQNDAHIYVQPEKAVEEFVSVFNMHKYYYDSLGIKEWWAVLGIRDPKNIKEKYHGDEKMWELAEKFTKEAVEKAGVKYRIEEGGAAHYGPKLDIYIKSSIGKEYAIGTTQLDLYMPQRFNLTYTDENGKEQMPYVIHRAPLGSHERMIGFLLEHYAGAFPLWLAPVQAVILPIADRHLESSVYIKEELEKLNIRVMLDHRKETLQARIRDNTLQKVPYMGIIGDKEIQNPDQPVTSVRTREGKDLGILNLSGFIQKLKGEIDKKI